MFIGRSSKRSGLPRAAAAVLVLMALLGGAANTYGEEVKETSAEALMRDFLAQHGVIGKHWNHMIATVPDPIDTPLSREFDLALGALRRALESMEFVLDRHHLPWRLTENPLAESELRHRDEPGLMLFRRSFEVLPVWLVGETATRGVHDGALRKALDQAEKVAVDSKRGRRIQILTPFFSGSRHALLASLELWIGEPDKDEEKKERSETCFELSSGTATNPGNKEALKDVPGIQIAYRSAPVDDELGYMHLLSFLAQFLGIQEDTDPQRHQIALLVESSIYGGYFESLGEEDRTPLILPFPMHISQLRAELDKERENEPENESDKSRLLLGDPRRSHGSLPVYAPVQTSRTQELTLAAIVRTLARYRVQAVGIIASDTRDKLFLADAIRRHAPDVRLFTLESDLLLAHPDYREGSRGMIVASSHSLRYPAPGVPAGDRDDQTEIQFASEHAQGIFVAARALIADADSPAAAATPSCAGPPPTSKHVWFSVVGNGGLWPLTRSGARSDDRGRPLPRGWPLLFATATIVALLLLFYVVWFIWREIQKLDRNAVGAHGWWGWLWPYGIGMRARRAYRMQHFHLCLLPVVAAGPHFLMALPILTGPTTWQSSIAAGAVLFFHVVISILLLALWVRTAGDWLRYREIADPRKSGRGQNGPEAIGNAWKRIEVAIKRRLTNLRGHLVELRSDPAASFKRLLASFRLRASILAGLFAISWPALFATLIVAVLVWLEWLAGGRLASLSPFLLQRSLAISSGVSPLLPIILVLAVPLLWLLSNLSRQRALETVAAAARRKRRAESPSAGAVNGSRALGLDLNHLLDRVRRAIDPSVLISLRWHVAVLVILGVGPFLYLLFYYGTFDWRALRGVEAPEFDHFMTVFFWIAMLLVIGSFVRFATGWWYALRPLTDGLKNLRFDRQSLQGRPVWWEKNSDRVRDMVSASPSVSGPMRASIFRRVKRSLDAFESDDGFTTRGILKNIWQIYENPRPEDLVQAWEEVIDLLEKRREQPVDDDTEEDASSSTETEEEEEEQEEEEQEEEEQEEEEQEEEEQEEEEQEEEEQEEETESLLIRRARSFFAIETAFFVAKAVSQLRQLLVFSTLGLVLLLLTVSIYPFEPQRVLFFYVWSLIAASGGVAVWILFEMERDAVISWISGTKESEVSWDRAFVVRFVSYAGLPILALLADQFPQIRDALFQWVEPLTKLFL